MGIREISQNLEFSSSYTLIEHAPVDSIETEINPAALEAVQKVKSAVENRDFGALFNVIGVSDEIKLFRAGEDEDMADPEHTSSEHTVVEGVLRADPTGYWVRHPFINRHLQRMMARWAFKLCTAGGFKLPAFALADDGYLVLHQGRIYSGSDWIPESTAINNLASSQMLIVRYPIRTKGDLLPVRAAGRSGDARDPDARSSETSVSHGSRHRCRCDRAADNSLSKERAPSMRRRPRRTAATTTSTGYAWSKTSGFRCSSRTVSVTRRHVRTPKTSSLRRSLRGGISRRSRTPRRETPSARLPT